MFRSFYAVTKDRKGGIHQFRLNPGEGVPRGQEIIDLKVAGQYSFAEIVSKQDIWKMHAVAAMNPNPKPKVKNRSKRAPKE